jgi:hypothetical protein
MHVPELLPTPEVLPLDDPDEPDEPDEPDDDPEPSALHASDPHPLPEDEDAASAEPASLSPPPVLELPQLATSGPAATAASIANEMPFMPPIVTRSGPAVIRLWRRRWRPCVRFWTQCFGAVAANRCFLQTTTSPR